VATVTKDIGERTRQLEAAATHYRRAASVGSNAEAHRLALRLLAQSYDTQRLKDAARRAGALSELIRIAPDDLHAFLSWRLCRKNRG